MHVMCSVKPGSPSLRLVDTQNIRKFQCDGQCQFDSVTIVGKLNQEKFMSKRLKRIKKINKAVNKLRVDNMKFSQARELSGYVDTDTVFVEPSLKYSTPLDYEAARQEYHDIETGDPVYGAPASRFVRILAGLSLTGLFPFDEQVHYPIALVEAAWQLAADADKEAADSEAVEAIVAQASLEAAAATGYMPDGDLDAALCREMARLGPEGHRRIVETMEQHGGRTLSKIAGADRLALVEAVKALK